MTETFATHYSRPPRRSMLYVPGDSRRKIEKAATSEADALILDLEDGIARGQLATARTTVLEALTTLDFDARERIVRLSGSDLAEEVAMLAVAQPDGFLLPKAETAEAIVSLDQMLYTAERVANLAPGTFAIHAMIESAAAVVNLREICRATSRLQTLIFGAEDYAATIGATRSPSGVEIAWARGAIVAHAAAHGLSAIDCVYLHYQDAEGFSVECALARQIGFAGKTLIHPAQIAPCNQHFAPSPGETAWAERIIQAFDQRQQEGIGAFNLDGVMVDRPLYLIAQQIMARSAAG